MVVVVVVAVDEAGVVLLLLVELVGDDEDELKQKEGRIRVGAGLASKQLSKLAYVLRSGQIKFPMATLTNEELKLNIRLKLEAFKQI
jgi:hypothetical protein